MCKLSAVLFCLLVASRVVGAQGAGSRVRPGAEPAGRIHATPGYPLGVTVGLTFRFGGR
jgi:hypothetical protein